MDSAETSQKVIRIMIVDDHAVVRRGLAAYVSVVPEFQLVGQADDGEQAIEQLKQWQTKGHQLPHVVLMDLQMPGMGGIIAT